MMQPGDQQPEEDEGPDPEPGMVLATGTVIYGAMGGAALLWLWSRDRWDALAEQAVGEHGPLAASGVGLAIGLVGAWLLNLAFDRLTSLKDIASAGQRLFARTGDGVAIAFVLISAVAEELFFRLAVQDVFGLVGSVAVYVLLNSTVGGMRWLLFTLVHALVLGSIVHFGFGLLGSATAHAILNYLSLRRIQDS